jgi:uncharacterized cupin superfamily protein
MRPVTEADCEPTDTDRGETAFRRWKLGAEAGGQALGTSLYEVPPGRRSWPYHFHTANEEALFVLSGSGILRGSEADYALEPGTYAAFPADESGAHQVVNDGDEPLRYLVVSTMRDPDVTVYPDSGKVGVMAGAPPGGDRAERVVSAFFREADAVGYWD